MYIDVRAQDRGATLPDAESAIAQVIALQFWAKRWNTNGAPFGHVIEPMQRINDAIRGKDRSAFKAEKRRGYWRVTLA